MINFEKPVLILYAIIIIISDETQPAEGYAGEPWPWNCTYALNARGQMREGAFKRLKRSK